MGFPTEASSEHDAKTDIELGVANWRPVGSVHRFHDYTSFSPPWLSTAAAIAMWLGAAYVALSLDDMLVAVFVALGAVLMSIVAYAGWFPKDRLEVDMVGCRLLRVPPSNKDRTRDTPFALSLAEIQRVQIDERQDDVHVIAQPVRLSIYSAKREARARRVARKFSALTKIPFVDD